MNRFFCSAAASLAIIAPAAAQAPADVVSIYSSICFNDKSGDLNGARMIVLRGGPMEPRSDRFFVVFQDTGGMLQPPIFQEARIEGDRISLRLQPPGQEALTFVGRITPQSIEGGYEGRDRKFVLRRLAQAENRFDSCP